MLSSDAIEAVELMRIRDRELWKDFKAFDMGVSAVTVTTPVLNHGKMIGRIEIRYIPNEVEHVEQASMFC